MRVGQILSSAAVVVLLVGGCAGGSDDAPAPTGSTRASTGSSADAPADDPTGTPSDVSASPTQPGQDDPDGGISADEARRRGVLFARYDARLTDAKLSGSSGTATLTNVGQRIDAYDITLEPADGGVVSPARVTIKPGESVDLHVTTHLTEVVVRVASRGRDGAGVADVTLSSGQGR